MAGQCLVQNFFSPRSREKQTWPSVTKLVIQFWFTFSNNTKKASIAGNAGLLRVQLQQPLPQLNNLGLSEASKMLSPSAVSE